MKKVLIASRNPVKINATKKAFKEVFTDRFEFKGVSVDSLVSDQPMSNDETLKGATNRLQNIKHLEADYLVSIEGGVDLLDNNYEAFAWIVISDKNKIGKAKTASFALPLKISKLIKEGYELGDADDMVFKRSNSKQQNGAVGILTNNLIDRTEYYVHAIILALIPFTNSKLY
jgi:inosine/xanthosine triphosphatase